MSDTLYIDLLDSLIQTLSTPVSSPIVEKEWYERLDIIVILAAVAQALITGLLLRSYDKTIKRHLVGFTLYNELQVKSLGSFYHDLFNLRLVILKTEKYVERYEKRKGQETDTEGEARPPLALIETWKNQKNELISNYKRDRFLFPKDMRPKIEKLLSLLEEPTQHVINLEARDSCFLFDSYNFITEGPTTPEEQERVSTLDAKLAAYNFDNGTKKVKDKSEQVLTEIDNKFAKFE